MTAGNAVLESKEAARFEPLQPQPRPEIARRQHSLSAAVALDARPAAMGNMDLRGLVLSLLADTGLLMGHRLLLVREEHETGRCRLGTVRFSRW